MTEGLQNCQNIDGVVDTALVDKPCYGLGTPEARMICFVNKPLVNVGGELSKLVHGCVSTEVDAFLANVTHLIVGKVQLWLLFT
ncbi:putative transaldolase/Fructose-6-phosphate aldolase [Helianthus annuus]|nr:putative transaldolase/Fructose-6-phosphate aldolase [Helianthus annuus]